MTRVTRQVFHSQPTAVHQDRAVLPSILALPRAHGPISCTAVKMTPLIEFGSACQANSTSVPMPAVAGLQERASLVAGVLDAGADSPSPEPTLAGSDGDVLRSDFDVLLIHYENY